MTDIYDIRRYGKAAFLIASAAVVALFLYFSDGLIRDLSTVERERMQLWADATKELVSATTLADNGSEGADVDFLLGIIQSNTTIPVLLTDAEGNILQQRNFALPVAGDDEAFGLPSEPRNIVFLREKLEELRNGPNVIAIEIADGFDQYLYYEDSTLLRRLSIFPYIQLLVMLAFIAVVYFAVLSTKKAEQNKVWVGLSKETAHQLGTPISSLMAWMELLPDYGVDADTVAEMNKDVTRLSTIASRFSKIGSPACMGDREPHQECRGCHGRHRHYHGHSRRDAVCGFHRSGRYGQGYQPQEPQDGVQSWLYNQESRLGPGAYSCQAYHRAVSQWPYFREAVGPRPRYYFPYRTAARPFINQPQSPLYPKQLIQLKTIINYTITHI